MGVRVKRTLGVVSSALIAVALIVAAPRAPYAQPGSLAVMAKAKAAKELGVTAMKRIDKNIADAVGKKLISDADKANITKMLSEKANLIVTSTLKPYTDGTTSGELPDADELVSTVMKEIQPQMDELVTAAINDAKKAPADTVPAEPASKPKPVTVTETAPSQPTRSHEASVNWTVNNTATWIEMINGVKTGGDGKNHAVTVSGDISVPAADNGNTFGSVKQLTVILEGGGTLSLSGDGNLLNVGAGQTVSVKGTLNLKGRDDNIGSVVVVDGGGTFRMGGSAAVTGNTVIGGDGGGVFVRAGKFIMDESSSVLSNSAKGSGGGVFVYDGELTMQDSAKVLGNTANNGGGGVYVESGKLVMTDAAKVSNNTVWLGGGVYVGSAGIFVMQGYAAVSGNTAYRQGGGVYFAGKDFIIEENAAVSGNTASRQGNDVYFAGRNFTMQGNAKTLGDTINVDGGIYFAGKAPAQTVGGGGDDNR